MSEQLESLVLAAMLDDGISPHFLRQRLLNPEGPLAKAATSLNGSLDIETLTAALARLLERGLVTCRMITPDGDEPLSSLPALPLEADVLAFELWFELTPAGEEVGLEVMRRLLSQD